MIFGRHTDFREQFSNRNFTKNLTCNLTKIENNNLAVVIITFWKNIEFCEKKSNRNFEKKTFQFWQSFCFNFLYIFQRFLPPNFHLIGSVDICFLQNRISQSETFVRNLHFSSTSCLKYQMPRCRQWRCAQTGPKRG